MTRNNDHLTRINRIINYIQQNPEKDLSLQSLSKIASFSPYHFHRIFTAIVGENPNEYVRRERVERAAKILMHNSHLALTEVALQCGFSSSATFSRAFKERFAVTATFFRNQYQNRKNCKELSNNRKEITESVSYDNFSQAAAEYTKRRRLIPMKVEVRNLQAYHVAYVRILDGMEEGYNHKITEAFDTVRDWVGARNLFTEHTLCIGAVYETVKLTPKEKRRYDACFTVPESVKIGSGEVSIQDFSNGLYAVSRIEVDYVDSNFFGVALSEMGRAFEYMYGEWLTKSAFELEDKPCLEIYLTTPHAPKIIIEACVPVKPL